MELLIAEAAHAAREIEQAQALMESAAQRRRDAVRQLFDGGMSVRAIATALNVSPGVVQKLLA